MTSFEAALQRIVGDLKRSNVDFALVGGLAVSVRTEPRFTRDADFAVAVANDAEAEALIRQLRASGHTSTCVRHQLTMPAQDRVRRDKSRDLCEQPATKRMYQLGEATPLAVLETKALAAEPGQAILFAQERDDISLLTLEPAAQGGGQQLEREHGRSLRHRTDPSVGTTPLESRDQASCVNLLLHATALST